MSARPRESYRRAALVLAEAWTGDKTVNFQAELLPRDRVEAYAVQDEMACLLTADGANALAGWKVGATSPGVQRAEGYDGPIPGRIIAATVYGSGSRVPLARCHNANVEVEVAFRFGAAPHGGTGWYSAESLAEIVTALPALDITGTRYTSACRTGWDSGQNMLAGIADNGNGGAVVLGEEASSWTDLDFMQLGVDLRINGGETVPNLWDESRGDPIAALLWTVNQVYERGFALAAGDVVLTGSLTMPQPLQPGDGVACHMHGLGSLNCQVSRA